MNEETQLVHFDQARQALALASSIDEVKLIRDQAEAIRQYIRQQKGSLEMQNQAAEIKIRAERRAGEMLREMDLNEGGRPPEKLITSNIMLPVTPPKLEDLGISKIQSHRWQMIAEVPEAKVEEFIAETKAKSDEITSRAILGIAMKIRHEAKMQTGNTTELPDGLYRVIVIDPPWQYGRDYDPFGSRVGSPYPEMSVEEITMLDIPAADGCILWLWTTNAFMHDAYHILEAWAFEPKTILTWFKERTGVGYWLRGETEHCILATRGTPNKLSNEAFTTHLKVKSSNHSAKPNEFYELVEKLCGGSTEQTHLEMFARVQREGWATWGNQITKQ